MSSDNLDDLKNQARRAFDIARHAILMEFPFIGEISLKMDLIPTQDSRNPTISTDGSKVFIDIDFFKSLDSKQRSYVIAHEIWHCVMLHPIRKQSRNKFFFDMAADMEVNELLSKNNANGLLTPPSDVLMPPSELANESAETIYDWLIKNVKTDGSDPKQTPDTFPAESHSVSSNDVKDSDQGQQSNSLSSEQSQSSKTDESESNDADNSLPNDISNGNDDDSNSQDRQETEDNNLGNGNSNAQNLEDLEDKSKTEYSCDDKKLERQINSKPKQNKQLKGQFDSHQYTDEIDKSQKDSSGNIDADFNPSVSRDFANQMRETILAQAQKSESGMGTLPLGIEQLLKKLEKPEMPWHVLLAQFVKQIHSGRLEWSPPSRRHIYQNLYLQSHRTKKIEIALGIDTSGSCYSLLPKFFAELVSLMKSFDSYRVHCFHCDAEIEKYIVYDSDSNPLDVNSTKGIEWCGGGGSSMTPIFKYIEKNKIDVDACVVLTDGWIEVRKTQPKFPTLWVLPPNGCKDFCAWGKKLVLKDAVRFEE